MSVHISWGTNNSEGGILMESRLILKISSPILVQFWEKMEAKNTVKTVVEQHIVTFWAPGGRN